MITQAVGGAIDSTDIDTTIDSAVRLVINKLVEWLKSWLGDDVFTPKKVAVNIGSLISRFPGGHTVSNENSAIFKGHGGHYEITYDWRLFA